MAKPWEDASFNEETITDVVTARLALRWSLDRIRALQDENLRIKQSLQDKGSQIVFLDNQIKTRTAELQRIIQTHQEETQSRRDSLEYQLKSRLEKAAAREKDLEDRLSQLEESYRTKEIGLMAQYQKKSDELRERWSQVEAELWQVRQDNLLKQQEIEKGYKAASEGEKQKLRDDLDNHRAALEKDYQSRLIDLERREQTLNEEMRKQEAVFKWAKASWEKDVESREKTLKGRELAMEKEGLEKSRRIQDSMFKIEHLEKRLEEFPDILKKRDTELDRYRTALESLESVVRSLENEKRSMQEQFNADAQELNSQIVKARTRCAELESEIPKRLKMAVEHERARFEDRLSQSRRQYGEDLEKKEEEIQHLETVVKSLQEMNKNLEADRKSLCEKHEQLNARYCSKLDEFHLREKQLESEYSVRVKVELEKNTRQLRDEMETGRKIYEETSKRSQEEIARLERDSGALENEKRQLQDRLSESRRLLDEIREKHENDMARASELELREKTFEGMLRAREQEIMRLRQRMEAMEGEKRDLIAGERLRLKEESSAVAKNLEEIISARENEIARLKALERDMEKKYSEISQKYAVAETGFQTRLQSAVLEESEKFQRFMDKKEDYIKGLKESRERSEESYRRDLESVRERVRETVRALEEFRTLAAEKESEIKKLRFKLREREE